jgi:hypothetical protein
MSLLYVGCIKFPTSRFVGNFYPYINRNSHSEIQYLFVMIQTLALFGNELAMPRQWAAITFSLFLTFSHFSITINIKTFSFFFHFLYHINNFLLLLK